MEKKELCTITFTGDISFDRYMLSKWEDENLLSKDIFDFLNESDYVVANVEGALYSADDLNNRGVFFHSMNPLAANFLNKINANIWNIANNHIMDAGIEGLINTISLANKSNYQTIGAGINDIEASKPIYINKASGIGVFAVAYMSECIPADKNNPGIFRWDDLDLINKRIKQIKENNRWCIIVSHGGEEFADLPNPYTRDRYLKYLQLGADIVVAHHPHVVENYELFDDKAIFYSLGNFIFDTDYQRAHPYTDTGVLLKLIFSDDSFNFESMGIKIDRNNERIIKCDLPAIYTNITEKDYKLLSPLSSKMFLKEEIKRMKFLEPERFNNASKEDIYKYFNSEDIEGYDKGSHMDLSLVLKNAIKVKDKDYLLSDKKDVVDYILRNK